MHSYAPVVLLAGATGLLPHLSLGQDIPAPLITFDAAWATESFSFVGSFQPVLDPAEEEDSFNNPANDNDNDGIWVVEDKILPAGDYDVAVYNMGSSQVYGLHGSTGPLGDGSIIKHNFTVEDGGSPVDFFFDWRDLVFEASTNLMPVVCGDFMEAADYYSTSVGAGNANWNPENLLGWLKDMGGNGVYSTYLRVPAGTWAYKICFRGSPLESNSVGFSGTQFPITLTVDDPSGADIVFTYNHADLTVSHSLGSPISNLIGVFPMLQSSLGASALSPHLPADMNAWDGLTATFIGTFGPALDTPEGIYDPAPFLTLDLDGDGIVELPLRILPGTYGFIAHDATNSIPYDRLGQVTVLDLNTIKAVFFTVPEPPAAVGSEAGGGGDGEDEEEYQDVTFFFDWRDKIVVASTEAIPVVCGDFMEPAGYFSGAEGAAAGANWNPNNMLGWMKKYDDNSDVYRLFLHLPQGSWEYKICFQGESLETSVGFGGTQFPFLLDITPAGGADIVFLYDAATDQISDSINLAMPLLLQSPMLTAPLGDRALSPYLPSEKNSWPGRPVAFLSDLGPFADPPQGAWDPNPYLRVDLDADGVAELHLRLLPGVYMFFPVDAAAMIGYDRLGIPTPLDPNVIKLAFFSVPPPPPGGDGYTDVVLFFDWRDKVVGASTGVMPVVCGDFMEPAGYFSGAEGAAAAANWNPNNLLGWMKKYEDGSDVYQLFLHVPQGSWTYKIGFYGSSLASHSLGFGGSVFPVHLTTASASGADVTFLYDHATGMIQDSVNGQLSSFSPPSAAPTALGVGDGHVLSPYLAADISGWTGASVAFPGDYGAARVTPQAAYDTASSTASDDDGDGIIELALSLTAGSYQFVVEDQADLGVYDVLGAVAGTGPGGYEGVGSPRLFDVVVGAGADRADVSLFVDLRDFGYEASTNPMPVVCGDFMAAAGYYGGGVDASSADWNPDNLMGWMKNYDGKGSLYQIYLHIPEGEWHYMVCFRGRSMADASIGFGGEASTTSSTSSPFPNTLLIPTGGMDVSFVYDSKWNVVGDSQNGLPLLTCSLDCGAHGTCVAEVCECDPGYVGGGCELEMHFSSVFLKEVDVTVNGTLTYSDGPPVEVPVSGTVTCLDLILNADGSTECPSGYQPLHDAVTDTVNGTIVTEMVDGEEVPVYADGPPVITQALVVDESRSCEKIEDCEFHCEEGWTGKLCTLRDHCLSRGPAGAGGAGRECEGGCETGWGGGGCLQRAPLGGGSGYGMDLGGRTHPWALPPVGARNKPSWRGGLSAGLNDYTTEWLCLQGASPMASLRTMESWVYLHPFSAQFEPAVMPLLSLGDFEWGLKFSGQGVFQQHLVFGDVFLPADRVNTALGNNLRRGAFPFHEGGVNSWVHVAVVLTPDEDDGGNFIVSSYINGELQFSSGSSLGELEVTSDTVRIGHFHDLTSSADSSHQQWARALFDEFRLWSQPQSAIDIKDRLHRPLTAAELAWPNEAEYPDCFFYLPFARENFVGDPGNLGGYFLYIKSIAGNADNLWFNRAGEETLELAWTSDVTAAIPSTAPIAGSDHVVVGDAGSSILFHLPSLAAEGTSEDALSYPPLVPLGQGGGGGGGGHSRRHCDCD